MKILVTGGTGYIGSHTCLALMAAGLEPVILDNLCNSKLSVLKRIEEVAGKAPVFFIRATSGIPHYWIVFFRNNRLPV